MKFIDYILDAMNKQGITAYKLCKDLSMSQQTFNNWKNGKVPAFDRAMEILIYLGLSADELYGIKEKSEILTQDEQDLIDAYRRAGDNERRAILTSAKILAPESGGSSTSRTG